MKKLINAHFAQIAADTIDFFAPTFEHHDPTCSVHRTLTKAGLRKSLVCVEITNIEDWLIETHRTAAGQQQIACPTVLEVPDVILEWTPSEIFCAIPPWELSWFEYLSRPEDYAAAAEHERQKDNPEFLAAYTMPWRFGAMICRFQKTNNAGWILVVRQWCGIGEGPNSIYPFSVLDVHLDPDGKIVGFVDYHKGQEPLRVWVTEEGKYEVEIEDKRRLWEFIHQRIRPLIAMLMAMNFLHCKNIEQQQETVPPKVQKSRARKGKEPLFTFKHLVVSPLRKAAAEARKLAGESETRRAMHICRGHFSHYGEAFRKGRLFGKYEGSFWVPDHVRGSLSAGMVKKDYIVKP